jgi:hypothetical protein
MLFHVTHTHDYQTCMAHREEARNEFNDGFTKAAAANKVQILATYWSPHAYLDFRGT